MKTKQFSLGFSALATLLVFALNVFGQDYPGATWIPAASANYGVANRTASDVRWVIIHTTEGTTASAVQRFQDPTQIVSAHYIISRDGSIIQMVLDKDIAYTAGNYAYNVQSINIEHERYGTSNWTEAQFLASVNLVKWLAQRYNFTIVFPSGIQPANPANGTGIIGHNQVPDPNNPTLGGGASHHTDPVNWDWAHYQALFTNALPDLTVVQPVTVSPTSVAPGGTVQIGWTEKNQGTAASAPAHNTKIFLSNTTYGTTYQIAYYGPMYTLGVSGTQSYSDPAIVVPASIPAGDYYVTAFIDCDQQVSEGSSENNNIGSSTPTRLTVVPPPTRIISLSGDMAFGSIPVGTSTFRTLTIYNNGNSTLTVSSFSYPPAFDGNWSGGTIAAGSWQTVTVSFSPGSAIPYNGNIVVNCDYTSGNDSIAASGTGTPPPTRIISLSGNLAFGNLTVGSSAQRTLTIANSGNSTMTVSGINYPSGFSGNWSGTIPPGTSRNVNVTFSPVLAINYGGNNLVVNTDATSGTGSMAVSGIGVSRPSLSMSRQGSNLVFTWPADVPGFMLEYTTNLPPTSWTSNSVLPAIVGGNYTVTIPITAGNKFYRLKK